MRRFLPVRDGVGRSCSTCAVRSGLFVGFRRAGIIGVLLGLLAALSPMARAENAVIRHALLIDVKGAIGFVSTTQLAKALETAKTQQASLLILRLDTPGGLLSSTREMIQAMLASPVPVVVYVAPGGARAASAGTYLVYASHLAAMAPATHLGAATPVALGVPGLPGAPPPPKPSPGSEKHDETEPATAMDRKAVNDAVAYLRTLAELRGRNADWAEKAVREAATLTASEALKERVVEVIASDTNVLLAAVDGRVVTTSSGDVRLRTKGASIIELGPDWKMQVMSAIADPDVAFLLLLVGIYGILFEFMSPGAVAPGVVGGISLIMALTALTVLPVSYGGLALLLLGIALLVAESMAPSFILGAGGLVAFVVGTLFLFDPAETDIHFGVAWPLIAGSAAASAAFFFGVLGFALKARLRPVRTGAEEMIGSTGEVVSWADGTGSIRVHGEIWAAQSNRSFSTGQRVRVIGRAGLMLNVLEPTRCEVDHAGN